MKKRSILAITLTALFSATFSLQAGTLLDTPSQQALATYAKSFKAVKTQAQLIKSFHDGQQVGLQAAKNLQAHFDKIHQSGKGYDTFNTQLESISKQFPGYHGVLLAEGTVVDFWARKCELWFVVSSDMGLRRVYESWRW